MNKTININGTKKLLYKKISCFRNGYHTFYKNSQQLYYQARNIQVMVGSPPLHSNSAVQHIIRENCKQDFDTPAYCFRLEKRSWAYARVAEFRPHSRKSCILNIHVFALCLWSLGSLSALLLLLLLLLHSSSPFKLL